MKRLFLTLFSILPIALYSQTVKSSKTFYQNQSIVTDLNNDGRNDTIFLSTSLRNSSTSNEITISLGGLSRQSFLARNHWTNVDSVFLAANKNAVSSTGLFLHQAIDHSVILLFGELDAAGYRGDFSIIHIKGNSVKMVFDRSAKDIDVELPLQLTDLDKDGRTEFIFRNLYEKYEPVDSLDADIGVYSPYLVYTIDPGCTLNKPLTKKYNEDHFVFAGYEYSEKIKILFPRNGSKPRVIK